jgi:hypothetical protein
MRAVAAINAQETSIIKVEGKNPMRLDATGWASIPAPMLVPETRNTAWIRLGFDADFDMDPLPMGFVSKVNTSSGEKIRCII